MAVASDTHIQPEKNRDPAEAGRDPEQLTAEGRHGTAYKLYEDTEEVQTTGDRNNRVTENKVNDHSTEPFNAPPPNAYQTGSAKGGQGITSHALAEELSEQDKLNDDAQSKKSAAATTATRALAIAGAFFLFAAAASAQNTVSCSARGQGRQFCRAETQNGALLQHDNSHGSCHYGSTWGFNTHGIYVSGGCSAEFLVNGPGSQSDHTYGDHPSQGDPGSGGPNHPSNTSDDSHRNDERGHNGFGNQDHRDEHLTLPPGTQIQVRLERDVVPQNVKQGDSVAATLTQDLVAEGVRIAPAGTRVRLRVTEDDPHRHDPLSVQLESLRTDHAQYNFASNAIHSDRESQNHQDSNNNGNPLGAALNALGNGGQQGMLSSGSIFTFQLRGPAHPESLNPDDRH